MKRLKTTNKRHTQVHVTYPSTFWFTLSISFWSRLFSINIYTLAVQGEGITPESTTKVTEQLERAAWELR